MTAIKYVGGESTGVAFEIGETLTVVVTAEEVINQESAPNPFAGTAGGYVGDDIHYTATVKDNLGAAIPTGFEADLDLAYFATPADIVYTIISNQHFTKPPYDPVAFTLVLDFNCPNEPASDEYLVMLKWATQYV